MRIPVVSVSPRCPVSMIAYHRFAFRLSLTPAPPPFGPMNCTPAFSSMKKPQQRVGYWGESGRALSTDILLKLTDSVEEVADGEGWGPECAGASHRRASLWQNFGELSSRMALR